MGRPRLYHFNDAAFDEPSEAAHYWAGFLMADGYIQAYRSGQPVVRLCLSAKDADHIERFRDFLQSDSPITFRGIKPTLLVPSAGRTAAEFRAPSTQLVQALSRFGVIPHKTNRACVSLLENNRDFWRGVIDGDGTVSASAEKHHRRPRISLVGHLTLLEQFYAFVRTILPDWSTKIHRSASGNYWGIYISGAHAAQLSRVLYDGATVYLPRKQQAAVYAMNWRAPKGVYRSRRHLTLDMLNGLRADLGTWEAVAKHLGMTRFNVFGYRRRLEAKAI